MQESKKARNKESRKAMKQKKKNQIAPEGKKKEMAR